MTNDATPTETPRTAAHLPLALILTLAAWLRLRGLNGDTLTNDEMLSWDRAHESLGYLLSQSLYPLHDLLARMALALGSSEGILRLPSALAGIAACWVVYALGKRAHSVPAGLVAALLLAISPFHALHSREARFYALLALAGLVVSWALWRALQEDSRAAWLRFGIVSIPALTAHLFMLPYFAALCAGAALVLISKPAKSGATRTHGLARLAIAAAIGASAVLALAVRDRAPTGILTFPLRSPQVKAAGERTLYSLEPSEFASYGSEMAFLSTSRGESAPLVPLVLLGVLVLGGLGTLFLRQRSLATIILAAFVLMPLPFFFLEVSHWHEAKYYAPLFTLAVLCIGVGAAELGRMLAMPLQDRIEDHWLPWLPAMITALVLLVAAAFLTQPLREAQGHVHDKPQYRWREAVAFLQETLDADDLVFYLADFGEDAASIDRGLHFYFKRDVPNGLARLYAARPFVGQLEPSGLASYAAQHPMSALWLVSINEYALEAELLAAIDRLDPVKRQFGRLTLWSVGAPTANLVADGRFEGEALPEGRNVTVTRGDDARGIRLEPGDQAPRVVLMPLLPHPYRLRNADFALWTNAPLGWHIASSGSPQVAQVGGPAPGLLALAVNPDATHETAITQTAALGSAAGHTVGIRALGRAESDHQLGLRLTVGERSFEAWHSGNAEWETIQLNAEVPPGAPTGACTIAVIVRPGPAAAVTDIQIALDPDAPTLDPLAAYTLSFSMRTAGLPLYRDMPRLGFVYADPHTGESAWAPLYEFGHTVPWQHYAFLVRPGLEVPAEARSVMLALQFQSDEGAVWLDEVQLEPGARRTPFTPGIRLPHDEQWVSAVLAERVRP